MIETIDTDAKMIRGLFAVGKVNLQKLILANGGREFFPPATYGGVPSEMRLRDVVLLAGIFFAAVSCTLSTAFAQVVCLPAPRLLTTLPMGGVPGSNIEVVITGENIDDADELSFSDPRITAVRKISATGQPESNRYLVSIAPECPTGLFEARVMTRLGMSSSRAFSVGVLPEVVQTKVNTSLATAMELSMNSVCNAVMTVRAVDFYSFTGRKGQRVIADCSSRGIDSKLDAVLILANAAGNDLLVERQNGVLDFIVPNDGKYIIKVHELTFGGGPAYFYRLALKELPVGVPLDRQPATKPVHSFSWPPYGLKDSAEIAEAEPNNERSTAQKIVLPCDLAGSFFPAADVDVFEFEARKGEVWWVEVASERLGLPTDPAGLVQKVTGSGDNEKLTDVAQFSDILSPVQVSSNGYTYDGPPYNPGSSDFMGKLEIPDDGVYRLQLSDLFGGTRNDPRNVYRLVIRKAAPEFALVAWGLHMELRNGDRNALSKPLALRGGLTTALEVVAIRRDGFEGEIELEMDGLPDGVTAQGLKIPAGKSRGLMLLTAHYNAPRSISSARISGRGQMGDAWIHRRCQLASMAWPIPESWNEIPSPRLLADVPVSVSGFEFAPLTVAPVTSDYIDATVGQKLSIPLNLTRRNDFSGDKMSLKVFGAGFEGAPSFDVSLSAQSNEAVLDLAALKTPPGEYIVSFYGSAVAKYRYNVDALKAAEDAHHKALQEQVALNEEAKKLVELATVAEVETKGEAERSLELIAIKQKTALEAVNNAVERLRKATEVAAPRDVVDIVVTEPMKIRVKPAENK